MEEKNKILIVDSIHKSALDELAKRFGVIYHLHPSGQEFKRLIQNVDVVVLRSGVRLSKEIINAGKRLKIIARAGVGIDNIDISVAKQKKVKVFNIPHISSSSVAEFTFGLILAIARKITLADRQLRKNIWKKSELYGVELKNKIIGIVGFGKIGSCVAEFAKGFGMQVLACVKNNSEERKSELSKRHINLVSFNELLKKADIISLHLPLREDTKDLITKKELELMKNTAYLINLSRGSVVNENDLFEALKNNIISGAATDVFEKEKQKSPLFSLDNIVITSHIGAMTFESQEKIAKILVKNITNGLQGKQIQNQIC